MAVCLEVLKAPAYFSKREVLVVVCKKVYDLEESSVKRGVKSEALGRVSRVSFDS
jgi:hypothetical protein